MVKNIEIIKEGIKIYGSLTSEFKDAIKNLAVDEKLKEITESIEKINTDVTQEQREVLDKMIGTHNFAQIASMAALDVISRIKDTSNTIMRVLEQKADEQGIMGIVQVFIQSTDELIPKVEKAHKLLIKASNDMMGVGMELERVKSWCSREIEKAKAKQAVDEAEQRTRAYGGAGGATGGAALTALGLAFAGPIGWIVGGTLLGVTAATSFTTAALVTELHSIKEIQEQYMKMIKTIEEGIHVLKNMSTINSELAVNIEKKKYEMIGVKSNLIQCNQNAASALYSPELFISILKEDATTLYHQCEEFLDI
eukprot:GFUD01023712.1.p1 GENE.GFUD01023712.1~~GFUD01023712.1.p1  ORF type:complete len:310 (+),score=102.10 GFUD01023712.1:44-973(+)